MKLFFCIESLRPPLTGIGNYTYHLLRELRQLPQVEQIDCFAGRTWRPADQVLDDIAQRLAAGDDASAAKADPMSIRIRRWVGGLPLAYQARAGVRNLLFRHEVGKRPGFIYHEPNFILKPYRGPSVTTVHDLSFVRYPQFHPAERVSWLNKQLPLTLARADAVITDSHCVRDEILDLYGLPPERVHAVHLGVDSAYAPRNAAQTQDVLQRHGLAHGRYLLFVGTLEPRKGLAILLDAYQQLPAALRKAYPLVMAGAGGWRNSELRHRIEALCEAGEAHHLSYVSSTDLPCLYAGAAVFAYPSLYEGFGLPVLEAMACGTPVVCTEGTSMAEFAGDGARLTEPGNPEALAHALRGLLEDDSERHRLGALGLVQAQRYTWARCARETAAVYGTVG